MTSRLEQLGDEKTAPLTKEVCSTHERIMNLVGNCIGVASANANIAGYGIARIGREIVETGRSIRKGLRRE